MSGFPEGPVWKSAAPSTWLVCETLGSIIGTGVKRKLLAGLVLWRWFEVEAAGGAQGSLLKVLKA